MSFLVTTTSPRRSGRPPRISKEIQEFASGKEESYAWDQATLSAALTPDQQQIPEQRGVLSPDEIHRLAAKTRGAVVDDADDKAACHSDYVDDVGAQRIQSEKLVQIGG